MNAFILMYIIFIKGKKKKKGKKKEKKDLGKKIGYGNADLCVRTARTEDQQHYNVSSLLVVT